jgi:hypothetical protein
MVFDKGNALQSVNTKNILVSKQQRRVPRLNRCISGARDDGMIKVVLGVDIYSTKILSE